MACKYPKGYQSKLITQFWTLIYLDSAPKDWFEILENWHIQYIVSPLHDKDVLEDGSAKKPHYHVYIQFDGGKSEKQCQAIVDDIGGANGLFEVIVDKTKAIRYLCHLDSPKKHLYPVFDIVNGLGKSLNKYFEETDDEKDGAIIGMIDWINKSGCTYFCDLIDYAKENEPYWIRSLHQNPTVLIKEYIKSFAYKQQRSH